MVKLAETQNHVMPKYKVTSVLNFIKGSLSNHEDDGSKNPTNLHI